MKILIVDKEIYLAQSMTNKLSQFGTCECVSSAEEALLVEEADIVLLSSTLDDFHQVIKQFSEQIIIMMIPYINDEMLTAPIKAGASDYIVKPFMMDELLRKVAHFVEFKENQQAVAFYRDYFCKTLLMPAYSLNSRISFPLIIQCFSQRIIDMTVVNYAHNKHLAINFINFSEDKNNLKDRLKNLSKSQLTYIIGFENLTTEEQQTLLGALKSTPAIISCASTQSLPFDNIFHISARDVKEGVEDDILSIDSYIKTIILRFEDRLPDTDLSRKLGISRKSLWEKRKKLGVPKKKFDKE